jgi:hypothetical protein
MTESARMRRLVLLPITGAAAYLVLRLAVWTGAEEALALNRYFPSLFVTLAVIGGLSAAGQFRPGDYLRPAWALLALSYLVLILSTILRAPNPPTEVVAVRLAMVIVSNAAQVSATLLLSRAWRVAGLELPARRTLVTAASLAVALLVAGPPLYVAVRDIVATGRLSPWLGFFSSVGDVITFTLVGPIGLTAWTLRGGLTSWPWLFYTAQILAWLVFDAQDTVGIFFVAVSADTPEWIRIAAEPFRIIAASCAFAAGWSQRWVARGEIS